MSDTPKIPARRGGRPPVWTAEDYERVLDRLCDGELLTEICSDPGLPGRTAVFQRTETDPMFANAFARARVTQAHVIAEKAFKMASNTTSDDAAANRLKFDAARWLVGKIAPRQYSDKSAVELTGQDGGPIQVQAVPIDAATLSPEERAVLRNVVRGSLAGPKGE
jgi:hypothetical protein